MRTIVTRDEVEYIIKYLEGDGSFLADFTRGRKQHRRTKVQILLLMGGKLFFRTSHGSREVIADDDEEKIKNILDVVHGVAHRGILKFLNIS